MATVTLLNPANMNDFADGIPGDVFSFDPARGPHVIDVVTSAGFDRCAAYSYGTFESDHFSPFHVREVLFATWSVVAGPDIRITGIAFTVDFSYQLDVLGGGDLLQYLLDLLRGNDTVIGSAGADTLNGWDGNDTLIGGGGADLLTGGLGSSDTASYATAPAGLFAGLEEANFNTGHAAGDTYDRIENLTGSAFNDFLYGSVVANRLTGLAGNDWLVGKEGADRFDGGAGSDTVSYDSSFDVRADLLQPSSNTGDAIGDVFIAIENLDGSSFDDTLLGNNAANVIRGSSYPNAASGNDRLFGRGGNDKLFGFDGNDTLTGGLGLDMLNGGAGADRFDFDSVSESPRGSGRDVVTFVRTQGDKIDLSTIDADTDGTAGNQAFRFIGAAAFAGVDGQLRFAGGLLQGDVNGDRIVDIEIRVIGALVRADLIL
jgi:Ca2+-binding RTX toxin-like protein